MKSEQHEINLQRIGMKRRKKEVRFMRVMAGLMCFFLTLVLLFQDNMNQYQMEMNYHNYGEWIIREPIDNGDGKCSDNPYIKVCGEIWSGGEIYREEGENEPKDLEVEATDDDRMSGKRVGVLDPEIMESGHLDLYEGRLPESRDEIVMELSTLQVLGCNYDLGQKISFYLPETEADPNVLAENAKIKLHKVTFTLVGTLQAYTSVWNGGEVLPNAIIQQERYDELIMAKKGYRFYQLKEQYTGADVSVFANKLMNSLSKSIQKQLGTNVSFEEAGYAVNDFAYSNPFWSNKMMYRNMTVILIVLGCSIMAYLMSVYLSKRKKYYLRLREIGATLGQVLHMSVYECIGSTGPSILIGLIIAYGTSVLAVWIVAVNAGISFFYVFQWKTLLQILLSVGIVLGISFVCSWVIFQSSRITENRNKLSKYSVWRLRKRAHKHKRLTVREWEKRFRICQPVSVVLVRLIGIGVCICVLACMMQIYGRIQEYHNICQEYTDFVVDTIDDSMSMYGADGGAWVPLRSSYVDAKGEEQDTVYLGSVDEIRKMERIIPDDVLRNIRELQGIQTLDGSTRDKSHVFDWKNKGRSQYYKEYLSIGQGELADGDDMKEVVFDITLDPGQEYQDYITVDTTTDLGRRCLDYCDSLLYEGRYYQNTEKVWKRLQSHLENTKADYTDFCEGKQVILLEHSIRTDYVESEYEVGEGDFVEVDVEPDDTIQEGDELTIHTKGQDVTVTVGAILSVDEVYNFGISPYSIVGSETLGKKIAEEDGIPYGYNHIEINFNELSSSEATDKIITRQCTFNKLVYDSGAEYRRAAFRKIIQSILIYGGLAVIIVILYLFVLSSILLEEYKRKRERQAVLLQLGVKYRQISRQSLVNGIRESLYLLWSIPLAYLVQFFKLKEEWDTGDRITGMTSIFFDKMILKLTFGKFVFYSLLDAINPIWVIIYIFMIGLVVTMLYLVIGKMGSQEEVIRCRKGGEEHE